MDVSSINIYYVPIVCKDGPGLVVFIITDRRGDKTCAEISIVQGRRR